MCGYGREEVYTNKYPYPPQNNAAEGKYGGQSFPPYSFGPSSGPPQDLLVRPSPTLSGPPDRLEVPRGLIQGPARPMVPMFVGYTPSRSRPFPFFLREPPYPLCIATPLYIYPLPIYI